VCTALLLGSGVAAAQSNRDIAIAGDVLTLDAAGRVGVELRCAPDAARPRCRGVLRIIGAERPVRCELLGLRRYNIPRGQTWFAFARISRAARSHIAGEGLLSVTARTSGPR
jgi:hypothetical protein